MTDIPFSEPEMTILQKGPKYNLHSKPKNWLQTLAIEAETAITRLPPSHREVYRMLTAEHINTLQENNRPPHAHNTQHESKIIQNIKTKLNDNNAMITRADKGNSLVILPTEQYENKVEQFIQSNNFLTSKSNPTESFQTQVRKVVNNNKALILPDEKWKHINLNPSVLSIKGFIKLHKPEHPIRPVVNWRGAPAYKLAQLFANKIHHKQHQRAHQKTREHPNSPAILPSLARHFQPIHQCPSERNQRHHCQQPGGKWSGPPNQT